MIVHYVSKVPSINDIGPFFQFYKLPPPLVIFHCLWLDNPWSDALNSCKNSKSKKYKKNLKSWDILPFLNIAIAVEITKKWIMTLPYFLLHYLQEYSKIWNIANSNKSELWNSRWGAKLSGTIAKFWGRSLKIQHQLSFDLNRPKWEF